ncbi:MAG: hypothetical protein KGH89_04825 [Thaumarchaeota archaeon]|nr:hypothetical protein [Nitrososphaerota archaeon]MDE1866354.1 hypothetical protein [Nitrososphaerota archaeon]
MTQDLNPMPWGAQDRFQAHFIVKVKNHANADNLLAKTTLKTSGHFATKKVSGVKWVGGNIAKSLSSDEELRGMILKLPYNDALIWVEPTKTGVRIHGKWKSSRELGITKELFDVYDKIASHVKESL